MLTTSTNPQEHLILVRHCISSGERSALLKRVRHRELVAVGRGAYFPAAIWAEMDRHEHYRARIESAAASLEPDTVFSHESASALWRLPWLDAWPTRVHTTGPNAPGGRSNTSVFHHTTGAPDDCPTIDGHLVTPLARTVVDIARTVSFGSAIVLADAALRRTAHPLSSVSAGGAPRTHLSKDELWSELKVVPFRHGSAKATAVIDFADGNADRPGESISRVSMSRARLPFPQLQAPLHGQSGRVWFADFWWPEHNLIGEFDGKWKYTDPEFMNGRAPEQVLLDEKFREDDLRAAGFGMSRWGWDVAVSPIRLRAHLVAAGLR